MSTRVPYCCVRWARMSLLLGLATLVLGVPTGLSLAGDWASFRGPDGNGISLEQHAPLKWDRDTNVRWKAPLPGPGNSTPIVAGKWVFVTCATEAGKKRSLIGLDRDTGEQKWVQTITHDKPDPTHSTNPYCGSTPVANAEHVIVWHGSAGVYCYAHTGQLVWQRDLGEFTHIWGYGSSPILLGDKVILNCGPGPRQRLVALNAKDGNILWQTEEPDGNTGLEKDKEEGKPLWVGSWSTPVVTTVGGREILLVSYPHHVQAYEPDTGKILWKVEGLSDLVYTSPVVGEGVVVSFSGYHGPGMAFKLGSQAEAAPETPLWTKPRPNPQRIGSGVIHAGHLFQPNANPATMQCFELATGKEKWQARLPEGEIWGSALLAAGKIYVLNPQGKTYVIAVNPDKFELLETNPLEEQTNSSPVLADGRFYLRTFKHLWCIE